MSIFDIFITYVSWNKGGKIRPILIIEQQETVIFVFKITTQYENKSQAICEKYFKINDWRQAGLDRQSYVDTNNLRQLPSAALTDKSVIGRLTESDIHRFIEFLSK